MNQSILSPNTPTGNGFGFKRFQLEDYARGALHDGLILGHDTGLGKSIALYVWPALKVGFEIPDPQNPDHSQQTRALRPLAPVLLVVPGDLHQQTINEGVEKFKAVVTPLDSQETFLRLSTPNPTTGKRELPPGYYLTSYTQLTGNGVQPFPAFQPDNTIGMMQILGLTDSDSGEFFDQRETMHEKHYNRLGALPTMTLQELSRCEHEACARYGLGNQAMQDEIRHSFGILSPYHCGQYNPSFSDLPPDKKSIIRAAMTAAKYQEYAASVGTGKWYGGRTAVPAVTEPAPGEQSVPQTPDPKPQTSAFKIKCLWSPSLADLCQDAFAACAVDEGVKMKGEDTIIGTGVRQITAKYKLVLTATPIKNRLPDVFRLAWWATGARPEAHARFPYPDETAARTSFAEEFQISERNLTKEREKPARFKKLTPQVCNVHRLWKMFAPIILRRRKADAGEDIVPKIRQVVRVPMGKEQAAVYKFHIDARYLDKNGGPAIGAQLQALRIAAANPASEMLVRPQFDFATKGAPRSEAPNIPKLHSALTLIEQILAKGEQAVVFSAFNDSLDVLSHRLTEAGVVHCVADGRISQKRRGRLAAQFKLGPGRSPYQVMLAGVDCMAEGHSFPVCNNVILLCYSWAWDKFEQAINRVHRLNSRWPVNVWAIICERSIDRKLEGMLQEKGDACELVLDGHLLGEQSTEVNLAELLDIAKKEFNEPAPGEQPASPSPLGERAGGEVVRAAQASFIDEIELVKQWPPLRTALNAAARAWRQHGLELMGLDSGTGVQPVIALSAVAPAKAEASAPAEGEPSESQPPSDFIIPKPACRPEPPVLELVSPDFAPYAGLPLFDLV